MPFVTPYPQEVKDEALRLYREVGTAEAARRTGVSPRQVRHWAKQAGLVTIPEQDAIASAHAAAAIRVAAEWADYRSREALAAGAAAVRFRQEAAEASAAGNANLLRARIIAYAILIDKAEILSGKAAEHVDAWAETDLDRELQTLAASMEDWLRGHQDP
jgi:hypothetical protein